MQSSFDVLVQSFFHLKSSFKEMHFGPFEPNSGYIPEEFKILTTIVGSLNS